MTLTITDPITNKPQQVPLCCDCNWFQKGDDKCMCPSLVSNDYVWGGIRPFPAHEMRNNVFKCGPLGAFFNWGFLQETPALRQKA